MKIPTIKSDLVSKNYYEPVYKGIFEGRIQFPAAVDATNREIVLDNIISISDISTEKMPALVTQKFKGQTRTYAGVAVDDTSTTFTVKFNLNLDDANSLFVYNMFKQWSNLIYNRETGERGLKAEYAAGTSLIINLANKKGEVFRTYKAYDIFIAEPLPDIGDLDYSSNDIWNEFEVKFISDDFEVINNI